MIVYIVNFALNMLLGLLLCIKNKKFDINELNTNIKKKKIYLIVTALQFGLVAGFRSVENGYDTINYQTMFNDCYTLIEYMFVSTGMVEVGFSALCSFIKINDGGFQLLLIITSLFIMGSCCLFIYRSSKNVLLSVFIVICFPFYYSSFDIMRHFISVAFLLLAYKYFEEKSFIKYAAVLLIGSLFHKIALAFILFYFLRYVRWNWKTISLVAVGTVVFLFYAKPILLFLTGLIGKEYIVRNWVGQFVGGVRTAIMYGCILTIAVIAYFNIKDRNESEKIALNFVVLMFLSSVFFLNARLFIRLIMTCIPLMAVALPQLINKERMKSRKLYYLLMTGFVAIGLAYHSFLLLDNWQKVVPYVPFWS